MALGEDQVFGAAAERGVGALRIFRKDEELGVFEGADEDVAHLRGGFAAGEPVYVHAPDSEQLAQSGLLDGARHRAACRRRQAAIVIRRHGSSRITYPFPALRASSS